jgi:hypothetical protein
MSSTNNPPPPPPTLLCLFLSDWIHPYSYYSSSTITTTNNNSSASSSPTNAFTLCPLSLLAIYILWAAGLLTVLGSIYFYHTRIYNRYSTFIEALMDTTSLEKRISMIWKNKYFLNCVVYFILVLPSFLLQGIVSLALPQFRIGVDLLPSVIFFIFGTTFHLTYYIVEIPFLVSLLKSSDIFRPLIRLYTWNSHIWMILQTLVSFLPIICVYVQDPNSQFILMEFYLSSKVFLVVWKTVILRYIHWRVYQLIKNNIDILPFTDRALGVLKNKLEDFTGAYKSHIVGGLLHAIVAIMAFPEAFSYYWVIQSSLQNVLWVVKYANAEPFSLKQTKAQEIAALAYGVKIKRQASVYFGHLDPEKPNISTFVTVKEIPVGKDTLVKYIFGKPAALRAAKLLTSSTVVLVIVSLIIVLNICMILVVLGVLPNWVCWITFSVEIPILIPMTIAAISLKIVYQLLLLPMFWIRMLILILWCGSLIDIFGSDERTLIAISLLTSTAALYLGDALVEEAKTAYFQILVIVSGTLPFIYLTIAQFDFIAVRRDSVYTFQWERISTNGNVIGYQWSSMQAVRDFGFATCLFCVRDMYHVFRKRGTRFFQYLTAHIRVRVVKLEDAPPNSQPSPRKTTVNTNNNNTSTAITNSPSPSSRNSNSSKANEERKAAMKELGLTGKLASLAEVGEGAWTGFATQPQWDFFENQPENSTPAVTTTTTTNSTNLSEPTVHAFEEVDAWGDFSPRLNRAESNFTERLRIVSGRLRLHPTSFQANNNNNNNKMQLAAALSVGNSSSSQQQHQVTPTFPEQNTTPQIVKDDTNNNADHNRQVTAELAWVDTIVLYEKDCIIIHWLGLQRGAQFFQWMGSPLVRLFIVFITVIPLGIFVCGVLPGFLPVEYSYLMLTFLLSIARSFSMKSMPIMRLLTNRRDFMMEALGTLVILAVFAWQLEFDERTTALVMFYFIWLDLRLEDAKAVFFHSRTHGDRIRGYARQIYQLLNFFMALFFIAIPILLIIGAINRGNTTRAVPLLTYYSSSNDDNNNNSTGSSNISTYGVLLNNNQTNYQQHTYYYDLPRGTFAQIRPYQFISDFLTMFCGKLVLDVIRNILRGRLSVIHMEYLRGPIVPKFCDFAEDIEDHNIEEITEGGSRKQTQNDNNNQVVDTGNNSTTNNGDDVNGVTTHSSVVIAANEDRPRIIRIVRMNSSENVLSSNSGNDNFSNNNDTSMVKSSSLANRSQKKEKMIRSNSSSSINQNTSSGNYSGRMVRASSMLEMIVEQHDGNTRLTRKVVVNSHDDDN